MRKKVRFTRYKPISCGKVRCERGEKPRFRTLFITFPRLSALSVAFQTYGT